MYKLRILSLNLLFCITCLFSMFCSSKTYDLSQKLNCICPISISRALTILSFNVQDDYKNAFVNFVCDENLLDIENFTENLQTLSAKKIIENFNCQDLYNFCNIASKDSMVLCFNIDGKFSDYYLELTFNAGEY